MAMTYLEKGDTNMTLSKMIEALWQEREILEIKRRSAAEAQEWLERTPEWQALCKAKQELQRPCHDFLFVPGRCQVVGLAARS